MINLNLIQPLTGDRQVRTMHPGTSGRNLTMFPNTRKEMKLFTNQQGIERNTKPLTRANSHGYRSATMERYIDGWLEYKGKIMVSKYCFL